MDLCNAHQRSSTAFKPCGLDFPEHHNITGMWEWLLQQPAFARSNGSDHFLVIEAAYSHLKNFNVRPLSRHA
jgi:hypothetical protein